MTGAWAYVLFLWVFLSLKIFSLGSFFERLFIVICHATLHYDDGVNINYTNRCQANDVFLDGPLLAYRNICYFLC